MQQTSCKYPRKLNEIEKKFRGKKSENIFLTFFSKQKNFKEKALEKTFAQDI